jgi:hypothetical protein
MSEARTGPRAAGRAAPGPPSSFSAVHDHIFRKPDPTLPNPALEGRALPGTRPLLSNPPPIVRRKRKTVDWSTAVIAALVLGSAVQVYRHDGSQRVLQILFDDIELFGAMLPKVLAGCLIGAFIALLLPRELVARWLGGESGLAGLLIATVAGTIFPGGPITIYPVAAALLAVGADAGVAVAFVTSWTLLGYSRALVWELPFFGPDFVIWRMIAALPLPVIAGLLARLALTACRRRKDGA